MFSLLLFLRSTQAVASRICWLRFFRPPSGPSRAPTSFSLPYLALGFTFQSHPSPGLGAVIALPSAFFVFRRFPYALRPALRLSSVVSSPSSAGLRYSLFRVLLTVFFRPPPRLPACGRTAPIYFALSLRLPGNHRHAFRGHIPSFPPSSPPPRGTRLGFLLVQRQSSLSSSISSLVFTSIALGIPAHPCHRSLAFYFIAFFLPSFSSFCFSLVL